MRDSNCHGRRTRWWGLTSVLLLVVAACGQSEADPRTAGAVPGRLTETTFGVPPDVRHPILTDVSEEWGLGAVRSTSSLQAAGGLAAGDLDGDGRPDLAVAAGQIQVFYGAANGLVGGAPLVLEAGAASSVAIADLDGDGFSDLLVGVVGGDDLVVWGDGGRLDLEEAARTVLAGGSQTVGLLPADLDGDGSVDVLRISHSDAEPDVVWHQGPERRFTAVSLPESFRRSFAAEIADVDGDGSLDLWVTRDVGWISGADSIYLRSDAGWVDVAPSLGAALEIDGMGIVVADLDGDGALDTYVTDVGENEVLLAYAGRYRSGTDTGAGRIRPPGAPADRVSSSWAVASGDFNLDGLLDLVVANGGFGGADIVNKVPGARFVDEDTPALFLGIGGGRFSDVWPSLGIGVEGRWRGLVVADFDLDGDSDLVLATSDEGLLALRNDTPGDSVRLVAADPGCAAGYVVVVTTEAGSYMGLLAQHPFLGGAPAEVIVGTGGFGAVITVARPGKEPWTVEVESGSGRVAVAVPCG